MGLLVLAIAALGCAFMNWGSPILPDGDWKPDSGDNPISSVLLILLVAAALPYTLLASNSPLMQRWYSLQSGTALPYRLYALSNVGSLLALLSYPFLIEPNFSLSLQAIIWAVLYILFAGSTMACALKAARTTTGGKHALASESSSPKPLLSVERRLFWLVLAACPSCMLLAITNDLCQEVAVTPFLWILPFAIYLLTFILSFDHPRWYNRRIFVLLTYIASMTVLITSLKGLRLGMLEHLVSYSFFLFCFCMVCHGELFRLRPAVERLTSFYLTVALGGVTGGIIVGILAPLFFKGYWEFHLTILASWVLLTYIFWKDKSSFLNKGDRWQAYGLVFLIVYLISHYTLAFTGLYSSSWISGKNELANLLVAAAFSLALIIPFRGRQFLSWPIWPRLLIALLLFLIECFAVFRVRSTGATAIATDRNFFGVVKVTGEFGENKGDPFKRNLVHGKILHGFQYTIPGMEQVPTSYYVSESGIGRAIEAHPRRVAGEPIRMGVTGLGTGAITAHVGDGDFLRFYEINPLVVDYAMGSDALFSFINESKAEVDVKLGDARLALEEELESKTPGQYDILVLDAFSSDSVPVHLLTREAFEVYFAHLRDEDSILAVNISNRFLDLTTPVFSVAREKDLRAIKIRTEGKAPVAVSSVWVLMTQSPDVLGNQLIKPFLEEPVDPEELIWTDDFSNLWRVLR